MSTSRIDVLVLHCDQGMGTLVKVYDDSSGMEALSHLALIDLGSEVKTMRFAKDAVDKVMDALKEMDKPRIDLLVLSHQDTDHWSLLPDLQGRITQKVTDFEFGKFYRGGARWKEGALAAVRAWEKEFHVPSDPLPTDWSDYRNPKNDPGELTKLGDVPFRVLAVNVPVPRSRDSLIRNGTSAVIVVEFANVKVILPGDATADTIGSINKIFKAWEEAGKANPVTPCFMIGAPHHGSLYTLASNFTTRDPRLDIAGLFADKVKPARVAASAGYLSQYRHPYLAVMNLLGANAGPVMPQGAFVAWNDAKPGKADWEVVPTFKQIHTTIVNLDSPPKRQTIVFTIKRSGKLEVSTVERGGRPDLDQPPSFVARPH